MTNNKKKTIKVRPFFIHDEVVKDFESYCSKENEKVHNFIRDKKYTVKDTGVTYRVINHWNEKGLLPSSFDDLSGNWRKFSFTELMWLEVVKRLREFGLSLDLIKKSRDKIMKFSNKTSGYEWFEYHLVKTRISKMDSYVVVLPSGESDIVFSRDLEWNKQFNGSKNMVLISIKEIYKDIGLTVEAPESLFALSDKDWDLIKAIRTEDLDSASVKIKDNQIKLLNKIKSISGSDVQDIEKQIRKSEDFAEVITKFEKGKEQSAIITKKKKY